jgi:predicted protein tyrosine phosphatase
MEQYIRTNEFEGLAEVTDLGMEDLDMEQYIRINEFGERVVDYKLLDIASYASLLIDVENLAEDIHLDLDDTDFSDAERCDACNNAAADAITAMVDVEIEPDTKAMLIECLEAALLAKYSLA